MTVNIFENQTGEIVLKDYRGFGYIAMFTDSFVGGWLNDEGKLANGKQYNYDKLLDMRVFNDNTELHIYRGSIGDKLKCRLACDDNLAPEYYFDEQQLLDIDANATANSKSGMIVSTRGGEYRLPISSDNEDAVVLRNYISYDDETGRAQITDFRILRFVKAGSLNKAKEGK